MTTFAGVMDFDCPQPFNVAIEAEADIAPPVRRPLDVTGSVPVVAQEITPDRNLYGPRGRGVRAQGVARVKR